MLDFEAFQTVVEPVFARHGCDAGGGCHGGGIRGTFQLSPQGNKDPEFDFVQASLQVNGLDPEASALLQKPLAYEAGGAPHSFEPFLSREDADYRTVLSWIKKGELQ